MVIRYQSIGKEACFMQRIQVGTQSRLTSMLLASMAALLVVCIIIYPNAVFQSSLHGMTLWWEYVFPALLPFLILSEIMIGSGAIHALGTLFDPFMRFFFRISGHGGWALAMGLFAGYPAGASSTAKLRERNMLQALEAERVLAISHLCNPAIIIIVIGIGFFHQASLGIFIAIIHYISAMLMGLMLRNFVEDKISIEANTQPLLKRALQNAKQAQQEDGRKFGKLLGDGVTNSIQILMLIGGWMMFFSVLHQVLLLLLPEFLSNEGFATNLIVSLLEPHLGAYAITQTTNVSVLTKVAIVGAILAWSGLSVHSQVKSLLLTTKIRYLPFVITRFLHAALAFILSVLLWKPFTSFLTQWQPSAIPTYMEKIIRYPAVGDWIPSLWSAAGVRVLLLFGLLLFALTGCVGLSWIIQRFTASRKKPD
jgi:sporulation integral membrane protein YlbJ